MPFINAKLTKKLNDTETLALKECFGSSIAFFPGKSESWLMCNIEDGRTMYFKGVPGDCAFIEVKLFGGVDEAGSEKFTAAVTAACEKIGIPSSRVYVRFEGGTDWGWNGSNF